MSYPIVDTGRQRRREAGERELNRKWDKLTDDSVFNLTPAEKEFYAELEAFEAGREY